MGGQALPLDAQRTWNATTAALWPLTRGEIQPEPLHHNYFYHRLVRALPTTSPGSGPFVLPVAGPSRNNGAVLLIDGGVLSCDDHLALEMIYPVVSSAFFHQLRTKQQLGYLVSTTMTTVLGRTMAMFVVESSFAPPAHIVEQIEKFIGQTMAALKSGLLLSEEEMQQAIDTRQAECSVPVQDIAAMGELLRTVLLDLNGDFQILAKRCAMLPKLTRQQAVSTLHKMLRKENLRRLAVVYAPNVPPTDLSKSLPGYSEMKHEGTLAS